MDVAEILKALGGGQAVATRLGLSRAAVSLWNRTGIPASRCLEIAQIAKEQGLFAITLETLLRAKPRVIYDPLRRQKILTEARTK